MPNGPEDYRCRECSNFVLYRRDHKPECVYYVDPLAPSGPAALN